MADPNDKIEKLKSMIEIEDQLHGPPQESEYDTFTPEKVAMYDSALKELEGARAYVNNAMFSGNTFLPLAKIVAQKYSNMDPDRRDREFNELARFRAWKQGQPVQVYGPPAPQFSDARMPLAKPQNAVQEEEGKEKIRLEAGRLREEGTPEQKKAFMDSIQQQNTAIGKLDYFRPLRDWVETGRRKMTEYEMTKVGVPADQVERIKKQRGK